MKEKDMWSGMLVYIECCRGQIHPVSLELIAEAGRLLKGTGEEVYAAALGTDLWEVKQRLTGCPLEKIFLYDTEDAYHPILYERIMKDCIEWVRPSAVLIGGTYEGRALAPGLAVAFRTGLTADCTSLSMDPEGNLVQTRPAFGGNLMADIITRHTRPQFATVRPGIMKPSASGNEAAAECMMQKWEEAGAGVRVTGTEPEAVPNRITEQKLLVVAGRGVKKKEDLIMLGELAELLGGKLAASRALVEKGWMRQSEQIGLSGNTVSPEYMITCGVSGTVQFMAGMRYTKTIISINSDPDAGIFDIAHYPVCGDLYEIVPAMIEKLKTGERG